MNTLDAIRTRRSTRKYQKKPVNSQMINWVVEAGRYAPSGGNSQSSHFFVITDPDVLSELKEMVYNAFLNMEVKEGMYRSLIGSIQKAKSGKKDFFYEAPCLIVVANQKNYGNNLADTGCVIENMMLAANELDLGSCWINQLKWLNEDPTLVSYFMRLGMKEEERIYGAMALGFADTIDGLPEREPLKRTGNEVKYI